MSINERIGEAIQRAAGELPDDWNITIHVESGSAGVKLEDPDGEDLLFPTNWETLDEEIDAAVDYALKLDSGYRRVE